jgi:hypothetical protein
MSVPADTGSGLYGHLGAIMPAAKYLALLGAVAYNVPIHLSEQALTDANATAIQISQANQDMTRLWNASRHITMSLWHSNS